jgi:hypothetical protein
LVSAIAVVARARGLHHGLIYPDGYDYLLMARGISEHLTPTLQLGHGGEMFVPSVDAALKPLFPAVVALFSGLSGVRAAADTVTVIAGGAVVVLSGALAGRLSGSRSAAIVAAAAALASPALAYWSGYAGPDTLAAALALGAALAASAERAYLAGMLGALCAATRPEWLFVIAGIGVVGIARPASRQLAGRAMISGAFVLAAVILLLRPPLAVPTGGPVLLLGAIVGGLALQLAAVWAGAKRSRAMLAASGGLLALALVGASGQAPALTALARDEWPLMLLAASGLLRACWSDRARPALSLLAAVALLVAIYAVRNPSSERYLAQLLPLVCVAAGLAAIPRVIPAAPARRMNRLARWAADNLALGVAASALTLGLIVAHPGPRLATDTFSSLAPSLARAPAGVLVSAAPDAYGFLLPGRAQRTIRAGVRGLVLLDGAQRAYAPRLTARGMVIGRLTAPNGFERPDGALDLAPALLVRGVVVRAP